MPRIEERENGNYVKLPSKIEASIIEAVNKYFRNVDVSSQDSKENLVVEIQSRLKPLVTNLVRSVAWGEGEDVFNNIANEKLDQMIKEFSTKVQGVVEDVIKLTTSTNIEHIQQEESKLINTRSYKILKDSFIELYVNGLLIYPSAYTTSKGTTYIEGIILNESVKVNDRVLIKCSVKGA